MPPPAGAKLVAWYKHSDAPIRVQAFKESDPAGKSFNDVPDAQVSIYEKGSFVLDGLESGAYFFRAFLDLDKDYELDDWEPVGYLEEVLRKDVGVNNYRRVVVPDDVAENITITLTDKDSDNDLLPDGWEYYFFKSLTAKGGYNVNQGGLYLWEEYADGALDANPLVSDTDGDGLPDAVELKITGTNNHTWDTDGDGVGDLEEFLAGSNPTDASEARRFASPAPAFDADGVPFIELPTPELTPGFYLKYTVLGKDTLDGEWSVVGVSGEIGVDKTSTVNYKAGTVVIRDLQATDSAFYKVQVDFFADDMLD